jgi:hypothetical protein
VTRANVTLRLVLTGDDKASASVKSAGASVESLEKQVKKAEQTIANVGITAETGFGGFKTAAGGAVAKLGLVGQGLRTVASAAREMGEALIEGARAGDRMDILRNQVAGVEGLIGRVKEATAGMLPEAEITKAIAQFKQFQIPIENIDKVLREVAATSVRTGEDLAFMTDSIIAGVARESALRIDNLGVILDADKTKKEYAATLGKEAEALTQAERKTALLNETMRQMQQANEGVNLEASRTASLERVGTIFEDLWGTIKTGLADVAIGALEFFGVIPERVSPAEQAVREYNAVMEVYASVTRRATAETIDWNAEVENSAEQLAELNRQLGREVTGGEAARLQAERTRLLAQQTQETLRLALAVDAARTKWAELRGMVQLGVDATRELADADAELVGLINELDAAKEAVERRDEIALETVRSQIEAQDKANAEEALKLRTLTRQVTEQERQLELSRGQSVLDLQIRDTKQEISQLNRENVVDMERMVGLLEKMRTLELARAAGAGLLQGFVRGAAQAGARRGGRGRRAERETLADIVALEEARLKAAGELSNEQQEQLRIAKATAELDKLATERSKRKISAQLEANRAQQIELRLVADLNEMRRKAAEERDRELERGLEAAKREWEIRRDLRAALAGEDPGAARRRQIQEALDVGAITGEEAADFQRAQEFSDAMDIRTAALDRMKDALTSVGEAGQVLVESQDSVVSSFGQFAIALQEQGGEISNMVEQIGAAAKEGAKAAVGATASAISVGGQLATAFIKDEQTKAVISGLIETAAAAASFAAQDYVGGALHTVAAGLYFAAAGTAGKKASAQRGAGQAQRPVAATPPAATRRTATTVININAVGGVIGGELQESGVELERIIRRSAGTGFESEAA